ncbi:hypothetical protein [Tuberibacillus sp. Marseille-P3662]|uniref:hypothetical protein n=1 Tax=Tuberibacillus sp. Marseille-P3662 TaxID=1965358 RepID=UPI000A1CAF12|nr:hypothetical protein [Tuberibacillus sp. Marseille-P3662]
MKQALRAKMLGFYDLILAAGAVWTGAKMTKWTEYPNLWASRLPFDSWVMPGVLAILIFGLGNLIAAILCLQKEHNRSWIASAFMGGLFFLSLIFQVIILGEWYLATVEFLILGFIQLCLSGYVFVGYRQT